MASTLVEIEELDLDGNIDEVIQRLQNARDRLRANKQYSDVVVRITTSGYDSPEVIIYGKREETPEERQRKESLAYHYKERRRQQYESLKKEFGD